MILEVKLIAISEEDCEFSSNVGMFDWLSDYMKLSD